MRSSPLSLIRANPDIVAVVLLLVLLLPVLNAGPTPFRVSMVSQHSAERVWHSLEDRMSVFEQKFQRLAGPASKSNCPFGVLAE